MRAHGRRSMEYVETPLELAHIFNSHLLDFRHRRVSLLEYASHAREIEVREAEEEMKVKLARHSVKDESCDRCKNID